MSSKKQQYKSLEDDPDKPRDSMDIRIEEAAKSKKKEKKTNRKDRSGKAEDGEKKKKDKQLTAEEKELKEKKRRAREAAKGKEATGAAAATEEKDEAPASPDAESSDAPPPVDRPRGLSDANDKTVEIEDADEEPAADESQTPRFSTVDDANLEGTFEPFWARAIGDFEAVEEGDLSIRYMQLVEILDMQPNGWWAGQIGDKIGWLPSNHLERVDPMEIFLQRIGLAKLYPTLVAEDVDMESMSLLTEDDLAGIGIKLGPRKQLLKALSEDKGGKKQLTASRDISHQEVRRTMSLRTGVVLPENDRLTKDAPRAGGGVKRRTSQFLLANRSSGTTGQTEEPTVDDFLSAAVYLKVIIPEQSCYKILAFEGSMIVKDCVRRVTSRLAKPLKRPMAEYTFFMPNPNASSSSDDVPMDTDGALGLYRPQNMSCVLMRPLKKRGVLNRVLGK